MSIITILPPYTPTRPYVFQEFPYRKIPLTKGYYTVVDKADYASLSAYKWVVRFNGSGKPYAKRKTDGNYLPLQNQIMSVPLGKPVDHVNGDGLDNRRKNLRPCSRFQNMWNRQALTVRNKTSPYKGVHRISRPTCKQWCAQICANGKHISIGTFMTPEEAALAYNRKATELFGEFAFLNTVPPEPET